VLRPGAPRSPSSSRRSATTSCSAATWTRWPRACRWRT
jgi:hypothetical protein